MCPACLTSAVFAVTGAISTGGLRALILKMFGAKNGAMNSLQNQNPK